LVHSRGENSDQSATGCSGPDAKQLRRDDKTRSEHCDQHAAMARLSDSKYEEFDWEFLLARAAEMRRVIDVNHLRGNLPTIDRYDVGS
jgi:hypothetical protein